MRAQRTAAGVRIDVEALIEKARKHAAELFTIDADLSLPEHALLAEAFNLSRAEVHGVVTYYHHCRAESAGRHVVQVCRAEACRSGYRLHN